MTKKQISIMIDTHDLQRIDFARRFTRRSRSEFLAYAGMKLVEESKGDRRWKFFEEVIGLSFEDDFSYLKDRKPNKGF